MCLNCIILENEKFTSCKTFSENPLVASVCTVLFQNCWNDLFSWIWNHIVCNPQMSIDWPFKLIVENFPYDFHYYDFAHKEKSYFVSLGPLCEHILRIHLDSSVIHNKVGIYTQWSLKFHVVQNARMDIRGQQCDVLRLETWRRALSFFRSWFMMNVN